VKKQFEEFLEKMSKVGYIDQVDLFLCVNKMSSSIKTIVGHLLQLL